MLSRETSSASLRPQRAKSTSSIKFRATVSGEAEMVGSPKNHQDALTAANLAYERANQHRAVQKDTIKPVGHQDSGNDIERHSTLDRRQSVRFVGPHAVPTRTRSITRREVPPDQGSHEPHRHSLPARPLDLPPDLDETSLTALPEEFNENYIASEPSSYRKLRKAKSMFSPRKAPSTGFADRTSNSRWHFHRHSMQSSGSASEPVRISDPRLKRSYSFLRGVTDRISTDNRQYATHDAAIQLARNTYLQQLEQQRLKEQPSIFSLGKRQRTQKAFRRTVRTSSTNSYGTAISSPLSSIAPGKQRGLGSKARTLSQTWREKIKRVFKRSSNEEETIPAQHLNASQPHYGGYVSGSEGSSQIFPPIPEPNTELLRRVGSRESSLRSEPIFVTKSPGPGSIRSFSSDDEGTHDKSRVTSWTGSTAPNTIKMPSFMERKRLSIIREDGGPHQSSSSSSAQQREKVGNGYANFRQPILQDGTGRVETKRIFSALQRQIDENNRRAALEEKESKSSTDNGSDQQQEHQSASVPRRRSSTQSSVRRIKTMPDAHYGYHYRNMSPGDTFNPQADTNHELHEATIEGSRAPYPEDRADLGEALTPQQIAELNESGPPLPKGPLREIKSAFFPPSTRIERSNASPYRRAMYAKNEVEDATTRSKVIDQQAVLGSRHRNGSVAGSESVYSRSSGSQHLDPTGSSISLARLDGSSEIETALFITSRTSPHAPSPRPFSPHRYSSTKPDGEWVNGMASQVAPLENVKGPHASMVDGHAVKNSRHKRESAQLDDDDVKIGLLRTQSSVPKQPLSILQANVVAQPHSDIKMLSSLKNRLPTPVSGNIQNENSPTSSPSVPLRNNLDKENESLAAGLWREKSNNLRQKDSHASLTLQSDSKRDTARNSPRCSPERAERLRRLKSSSVTTLRRTSPQGESDIAPGWAVSHGQQTHDSVNPKANETLMPIQAGMNAKLVNSFLKDRRRDMRISEERGSDPAFL